MSRLDTHSYCPICGSASAAQHAPFCSSACKDRDLLNWVGEGYRLPGAPAHHDQSQTGLDSGSTAD